MADRPLAELPIAVSDSGIGGLTVLHECLASLPREDFVYLGDTACLPYGRRSQSELRRFALELAELLLVACNSATAAAVGALGERLAGRGGVVAVVAPESRLAARAPRNGCAGLLATPAAVASGAYDRALAAEAPAATLESACASELAPLTQAGGGSTLSSSSVSSGSAHRCARRRSTRSSSAAPTIRSCVRSFSARSVAASRS